MRFILLTHRYLAVAIGLVMVLWCLSGFVMMYQSYPSLSVEQRLAALAPLDFTTCCEVSLLDVDAAASVPPLRIEMLLGDPVLRLSAGLDRRGRAGDTFSVLNLRTGQPLTELSPAQVLEVARQYGRGNNIQGEPRSLGVIEHDQWTIQTARRNQPAYHLAFNDPAATEVYISAASGEVFQATNRWVRGLSWIGAIPHWMYPTLLRQNGPLWTEVVIWTSVAGTFLAATGLFVGLTRLRRNRQGQLASPFRGWWYWHHISGLLFGVLALTWVFSGLMTMNPWGALDGDANSYRSEITGRATWGEMQIFLASIPAMRDEQHYKQMQLAPFNQRFHVLAVQQDGPVVRLDVEARLAQLTEFEVSSAVQKLATPVKEMQLMTEEDSYYYGHKTSASLPVYRILLDDAEETRLYINRDTGSVRSIDATGRVSRWIRTGLHSMDFPLLRLRPVWDLVVGLLLAGVASLCALGSWLAIKRVRMDLRRFRIRLRRRFAATGMGSAD